MKLIGYWMESLRDERYYPPQEFVRDLGEETRQRLVDYLDAGRLYLAYRGMSWCRFGCESVNMGSTERTDGEWVWPAGLSHYVGTHQVALPREFIAHVLAGGSEQQASTNEAIPDEQFWLDWCSRHSSNALRPRIEQARKLADVQAKELRLAYRHQREVEIGLSGQPCIFQGCTGQALKGKLVCFAHTTEAASTDPGLAAYHRDFLKLLNA